VSSRYDSEARKSFYTRTLECVNKFTPLRSKKDYYKDNKESILGNMKQYYNINKEPILEYKKRYHTNNKKSVSEHNKERYKCECLAIICLGAKSRHNKSAIHKIYIEFENN
jgi:hypothetical protein